MADELRNALNNALSDELAAALGRIAHCVGQLTDDQLWSRPTPAMNSIGNLMLHLAGYVRQLIVAGVGGEPDIRDRQAEFDGAWANPGGRFAGEPPPGREKSTGGHRFGERREPGAR